jgi:hypothetical protein
MATINYSIGMLNDFANLLLEMGFFMTNGLLHADKGLPEPCREKVKKLIKYSVPNSKAIQVFKHHPVVNYSKINLPIMEKQMMPLLKFMKKYLAYAESVLKECDPDKFSRVFAPVQKKYLEFLAKYGIRV